MSSPLLLCKGDKYFVKIIIYRYNNGTAYVGIYEI